jgi:hypothetical protein
MLVLLVLMVLLIMSIAGLVASIQLSSIERKLEGTVFGVWVFVFFII